MTPTGAPLLSWGWLSHPGDELERVFLLSARPALDCLRDMRRLDAFTPCQVRHRPRQLERTPALAPALRASASAGVRSRAQVHRPASAAAWPRPAPSVWRPVSSTGQWSRTWVGPTRLQVTCRSVCSGGRPHRPLHQPRHRADARRRDARRDRVGLVGAADRDGRVCVLWRSSYVIREACCVTPCRIDT